MARSFNATRVGHRPRADRSVHFIGDLHHGMVPPARMEKVIADIESSMGLAAHRVLLGDITDNGLSGERTLALAWLARMPAPWSAVAGNHDLFNQSIAQFAATYGQPKTQAIDTAGLRLLHVAPDVLTGLPTDGTTMTLAPATLTWLDEQLAAADRDCVIVTHAPLANSVVGPQTGDAGSVAVYSSAQPEFACQPDAAILAILDARPRAKMWVSGHTHSPLNAPDLIKTHSVGSRSIITLNASSPFYTNRGDRYEHVISGLVVTYLDTSFEIRVRDHGAGIWRGVGAERVSTVAVPA